jgi:hypothetical protein
VNEIVAAASSPGVINLAGRAQIERLEAQVKKLPQFDCPLTHYFVEGIYTRQIFIPAGVLLVGYIHMQPCITTLSQGRILIADGQQVRELRAPFTMTCPPGSKKAGYAIEDCVWSDAYLNLDNETDPQKLLERLTACSHEEFLMRFKGVTL